MCAQKVPAIFFVRRQIHIQRVLNVTRRMIRRCVQRVEAMPFVLDFWTVLHCETHSLKNFDSAFENLRERVLMAEVVPAAG